MSAGAARRAGHRVAAAVRARLASIRAVSPTFRPSIQIRSVRLATDSNSSRPTLPPLQSMAAEADLIPVSAPMLENQVMELPFDPARCAVRVTKSSVVEATVGPGPQPDASIR